MGCGRNSDDDFRSNNCICEVVRAIKDIQDNAVDDECADCPSCFMEPLGTLVSPARRDRPDTRVFVLKTADGSPFHAFFNGENNACVSIFFRVEDVFDNCCATLRVLIPGRRDGGNFVPVDLIGDNECCIDLTAVCQVDRFRASNDCITVDLKCFCGIQCIADVDLGLCD